MPALPPPIARLPALPTCCGPTIKPLLTSAQLHAHQRPSVRAPSAVQVEGTHYRVRMNLECSQFSGDAVALEADALRLHDAPAGNATVLVRAGRAAAARGGRAPGWRGGACASRASPGDGLPVPSARRLAVLWAASACTTVVTAQSFLVLRPAAGH